MSGRRNRKADTLLKLFDAQTVKDASDIERNVHNSVQAAGSSSESDEPEVVVDDSNDPIAQKLVDRWEYQQSGNENKNPSDVDAEIVQFHFIAALKDKVDKCSKTERTAKFRVTKKEALVGFDAPTGKRGKGKFALTVRDPCFVLLSAWVSGDGGEKVEKAFVIYRHWISDCFSKIKVPMTDWWEDDFNDQVPLVIDRFLDPQWNRPKNIATWVEWDIARFLSQRGFHQWKYASEVLHSKIHGKAYEAMTDEEGNPIPQPISAIKLQNMASKMKFNPSTSQRGGKTSGAGDKRHFASVGKPLAATTNVKKRKRLEGSDNESDVDTVGKEATGKDNSPLSSPEPMASSDRDEAGDLSADDTEKPVTSRWKGAASTSAAGFPPNGPPKAVTPHISTAHSSGSSASSSGFAKAVPVPVVDFTPDQARTAVAIRSQPVVEPVAPKEDSTFKTPIQNIANVQPGETSTPRGVLGARKGSTERTPGGPGDEHLGPEDENNKGDPEEENRRQQEDSRQEAANLATIKAAGMEALLTELKRYIGGRFASLEAKMTEVSDTVGVMSPNLNSVMNELNGLQGNMEIVKQDVQVKKREELEASGLVYDIPTQYGIVFPFTEMDQVKEFAKHLLVNNLKKEDGTPRNRRHELLLWFRHELHPGCNSTAEDVVRGAWVLMFSPKLTQMHHLEQNEVKKKLEYSLQSDGGEEAAGADSYMQVTLPAADTIGPFPGYLSEKEFDMGASKRCSFFSVPGIAGFLRDVVPKGMFFLNIKGRTTVGNTTPLSIIHSDANQDNLFKLRLKQFRTNTRNCHVIPPIKAWIKEKYKPTTVLDKWWSTNSPFAFALHKGWDGWTYGEGKYVRLESRHLYNANGDLIKKPEEEVAIEEEGGEEGVN